MKPDYSIALFPFGMTEEDAAKQGLLRLVHFDAKYKLRSLRSMLDKDVHLRTHTADDLDKMHAYLAAINNSRGAYVLFPGDTSSAFARTNTRMGVGAISLIPGHDAALSSALRPLIEAATVD